MSDRPIKRPFVPGGGVAILGTGSYLPGDPIPNSALLANLRLPSGWIERRTGIHTRHRAGANETTSDLAAEASRRALSDAGCSPEDLDRIILATISPDWPTPATACAVQAKLGAGCPAEDKGAACAGFLYSLDHGIRAILTGDQRVLAIGAEIRSRWVDPTDRRTAPIFADGAGAALLGPCAPGRGFLGLVLYADGRGADKILVPAGGAAMPTTAETVAEGLHFIRMNDGNAIFADGVAGIAHLVEAALAATGQDIAEVDLVIPHQANLQMIKEAMAKLGVPLAKAFVNLDRVGNTVGASVPIALDQARKAGRLPTGALVALVAIGGGYTGGAALYLVP